MPTLRYAPAAVTVTIGDQIVRDVDFAGSRGLVKSSGKANPAKKAQRRRQRKARKANR